MQYSHLYSLIKDTSLSFCFFMGIWAFHVSWKGKVNMSYVTWTLYQLFHFSCSLTSGKQCCPLMLHGDALNSLFLKNDGLGKIMESIGMSSLWGKWKLRLFRITDNYQCVWNSCCIFDNINKECFSKRFLTACYYECYGKTSYLSDEEFVGIVIRL